MRGGVCGVNYRGHLTVGIATFMLLYVLLFLLNIRISALNTLIGFFVCMFGSLAPDLDIKSSKIHRWSYIGAFFTGIALFFLIVNDDFITALVISSVITCILFLSVFFLAKLKHRGFTHHMSGFILFVICVLLFFHLIKMHVPLLSPEVVTLFGASGYLSHIIADFI